MRIGVALPTDFTRLSQEVNSVDTLIGQVKELADAGLSAAWFTQRFDHDAITVAALAAREVPGIDVGTAVVPIYPRHPIALSMQAQTAQAASHGRFTLGVGLSTKSFVEQTYGLAPHSRVRHLREHLEALRSLLETGSVDFNGETLVAKTSLSASVPGARPRVPVLVAAAAGEHALRAAGELADGALPIMSGPRTLAEYTVPTLTRHTEAAGRPAPRVAVIVSGVVTADVAGARARAEQNMAPTRTSPPTAPPWTARASTTPSTSSRSATRNCWRPKWPRTSRRAPPNSSTPRPRSAPPRTSAAPGNSSASWRRGADPGRRTGGGGQKTLADPRNPSASCPDADQGSHTAGLARHLALLPRDRRRGGDLHLSARPQRGAGPRLVAP
ncbi:TIGR03564 family F420-dependent LLM class oxidoreductase [Streptomyces sp. FXJ1.4098]|nr:TIGR03564 family F420-dependent LLM class oxidoreductase [Streptomyces sp. FXJ1.4098]